jgi:hypothetical protein
MYWVGKENTTDRVGRSSASAPVCETRWIVPQKPYEAPKGSFERAQNAILMGVAGAAILFGWVIIIMGAM